MHTIEIYGTNGCSYCYRAKRLCESRGYKYQYFDITNDPDLRAEFVTRTNGAQTVPQIFVGITRIGGFNELAEAERTGALQQLIGGE